MFKLVLRTAAASAVVLLSGAAFAATTLSINTALTTTDPLYKGLESFRDAVASPLERRDRGQALPELAARPRRGRAGAGACRRPRRRRRRWRPAGELRQGIRRARRALSRLGLRRHPQGGDVAACSRNG